uniref:Uncharacterized protein n=1 Tax=Rhizophora mucronata TaxID=61149 RepID=A0A2P2NFH0_RHIMU
MLYTCSLTICYLCFFIIFVGACSTIKIIYVYQLPTTQLASDFGLTG